jgi:hypothetical protein
MTRKRALTSVSPVDRPEQLGRTMWLDETALDT